MPREITQTLAAAAFFLATTLVQALPAQAAMFQIPGVTMVNVPLEPWVNQRFRGIVRQAHDLSCGAAALATLMHHFYQEDVTELELIEAMVRTGDEEKIAKLGFSMLELKKASDLRGYQSSGFRLKNVDDLRKLKIPVITLIRPRGYEHFVVLKRIEGDKVFLADPAFGNSSPSVEQFEKYWSGVILAILSPNSQGDAEFYKDLTIRARMGEIIHILDRVLTQIRPGRGEF
mgnify:CR=1 FL=1